MSGAVPVGLEVQQDFLRYCYVAAVERLCRIETVIERARLDASDPALQVFNKLRDRLNLLWDELERYEVDRKIVAIADERAARGLYSTLQSFQKKIPEFHETAVRWLASPWAPTQIVDTLLLSVQHNCSQKAFEDLGQLAPIVTQVGVYDFLGDFGAGATDGLTNAPITSPLATVVWATPAAEAYNPLSWLMLFHEVAHTLIDLSDAIANVLPKNTRDDPKVAAVAESYIAEFLADRIATDICGPAYFLALTHFAVLGSRTGLKKRRIDEKTVAAYPSAFDRVNYASSHLQQKLELSLDDTSSRSMAASKRMYTLFQGRCEVDDTVQSGKYSDDATAPALDDKMVTQALEAAYNIIKDSYFKSKGFTPENHQSAVRLADELRNERPISSSPIPGAIEGARELLQHRTLGSLNDAERDAFLTSLREMPNEPLVILNAAWNAELYEEKSGFYSRRERVLMTHSAMALSFTGARRLLLQEFDQRDLLTASSINASLLHRELEGL